MKQTRRDHPVARKRWRSVAIAAALATLGAATTATAAELQDVRVGRHPTFTRVVFELDSSTGYKIVEKKASGEIVVSIRARANAEELTLPKSLIDGVSVQSDGKTAVARIRLTDAADEHKEMILANPPRIVVDVLGELPKPVAKAPSQAKPKATASKPKPKATPKVAKAEPKPTPAAKPAKPATKTAKAEPEVPSVRKPEPKAAKSQAKVAAVAPTPTGQTAPARTPTLEQPTAEKLAAKWAEQSPNEAASAAGETLAEAGAPSTGEPSADLRDDVLAELAARQAAERREAEARRQDAARVARAMAEANAETQAESAASEGPGMGTWIAGGLGLALLVGAGVLFARRRGGDDEGAGADDVDSLVDDNPFSSLGLAAASDEAPEAESNEEAAEEAPHLLAETPTVVIGAEEEPAQDDLFQSVAADLASREAQNAAEEVHEGAPLDLSDSHEGIGATDTYESTTEDEPLATTESEGEDNMDSFTELTPLGQPDTPPPPPVGADMGAAAAQVERLVQELESRVAKLETRLEEALDARERLERQVAAQTEELRVQRAAIARTQRAVRNMSQGGGADDSATEPALKQP